MAPLYFSTRHSTSTIPPTSTRSQAMATLSYSTCQTTVAPPNRTTPSPSTQPSTPATSLMQGSTLTPRTSKRKVLILKRTVPADDRQFINLIRFAHMYFLEQDFQFLQHLFSIAI